MPPFSLLYWSAISRIVLSIAPPTGLEVSHLTLVTSDLVLLVFEQPAMTPNASKPIARNCHFLFIFMFISNFH
ncbi:hypothetical protein LP2241_30462 [Pseudolactococcus piscium]|nr:hypothetical protein LP2241_30462 [Lactococcus piscium]